MTVPSSRTSTPLLPGSPNSMWCYGPRGGGLCAALFKVYFEFFLHCSEQEVSIPEGWASIELVQRFYNLDNTGTVLRDLCTLALLPNFVRCTPTRSLAVLNKHSDDHPQTWILRLVHLESWRSSVLRVASLRLLL